MESIVKWDETCRKIKLWDMTEGGEVGWNRKFFEINPT